MRKIKEVGELKLEDIVIAKSRLKSFDGKWLERMDICKKHWEELKKNLEPRELKLYKPWPVIASLYGVEVRIVPGLKKPKLYYRTT